jgi:hypothetical protein
MATSGTSDKLHNRCASVIDGRNLGWARTSRREYIVSLKKILFNYNYNKILYFNYYEVFICAKR